jgi:hypothetical protein
MNKRGKNWGIGWREGGYEEKRKEGRKVRKKEGRTGALKIHYR